MPSPSQPLKMESLERRDTPAAVGTPWVDPSALTLSFAPDGTPVGNGRSTLNKLLNTTGATDVWKREVLRAFQTWAAATTANVAVVADGGQAFGTSGDRQGDNRFGDIRIGATPLSGDSVATAAPSDPAIGTWSGDVLFNTNKPFAVNPTAGGKYDLFTTALHEAGHVFGLDHSADPNSAVTERYTGVKVGLTSADATAIRQVYGTRQPDQYEGLLGNGTLLTATSVLMGLSKYATLTADLTAAGDVDVYAVTVLGKGKQSGVTVSTAGLSAASVVAEVYDAAGRLLARSAPTDPLRPQDFTFTLPETKLAARYFVRVFSPATDAFAIGRYSLTVNLDLKKTPAAAADVEKDGGTNDTPATATQLPAWSNGNGNTNRFRTTAQLESKKDVDNYRVTAPLVRVHDALQIQLRKMDGGTMPQVDVFDTSGDRLTAQVLESQDDKITLQVLGVQRGAGYVIGVRSPTGGDAGGAYRLTAEFTDPVMKGLTQLGSGVLTSVAPSDWGTLTLDSARLVNLSLVLAPLPATATVSLRVLDSSGNVVGEWDVNPVTGQVDTSVLLQAGAYTIEVSVVGKKGVELPTIGYWLFGGISSDPIGPTAPSTDTLPGTTSPPTSPPPPPPPPSYTYTGGTKPTTTTVGYAYKS